MTPTEHFEFLSENYDLIANGNYHTGTKIYIGRRNNRVCRFCGLKEPETTFYQTAHAIPELLGNKQLILNEECDVCNKHFSEMLEDALDKFTKPWRTICQIRGKRGIPSYKSANKQSRIDVNDKIEIETNLESQFVKIDSNNQELTLNFHIEQYVPIAVYKALVKIAISVIDIPDEIKPFDKTISWILSKTHDFSIINPANLYEIFIPGQPLTSGVFIKVFRKKVEVNVPYAIMIMGFGNIIYQIIVPSHLDAANGSKIKYTKPIFPYVFESDDPRSSPQFSIINLNSYEKISTNYPITLSFESQRNIDS